MKVTITIENDADFPHDGRDKSIVIAHGIMGNVITRHCLERGHMMTVQTNQWPLKVMDDASGRF